jgi:hypothetical protein
VGQPLGLLDDRTRFVVALGQGELNGLTDALGRVPHQQLQHADIVPGAGARPVACLQVLTQLGNCQ